MYPFALLSISNPLVPSIAIQAEEDLLYPLCIYSGMERDKAANEHRFSVKIKMDAKGETYREQNGTVE